MAYIVEYDRRALKSILKLDKKSQKQIKTYIKEIIENLKIHVVREKHYKVNIRENGDIELEITEF